MSPNTWFLYYFLMETMDTSLQVHQVLKSSKHCQIFSNQLITSLLLIIDNYGLFYSGYIQASRALMIAAVVCGTFGVVATLIGMQCSKACEGNDVLKGRIAGTGGVFFLLQGKD